MFVLRIFVVLVIVSTFGSYAEAQLFRFRANAAAQQQQQGYPSRYDARAYQYTQVQPQTNYVPSQRTVAQGQTPACNCQQQQQQALVPANSVAAQQQLQQAQLQQAQLQQRRFQAVQTEVVTVTHRDRYSGRLFQRQYLVQRPTTRQPNAAPQVAVARAGQQQGQANQVVLPPAPNQASSIDVSPELNPSGLGDVQATSFEDPILEAADESSAGFSVLNSEKETGDGSVSVLESSLPTLEAPSNSTTPGSILDAGGEIDLDLPPLELDDSQ